MSETATAGLSALDLRALRTADSVCFDHARDGAHGIRAIKRGPAPWHHDTTVTIECASAVRIYDERSEDGKPGGLDYETRSGKYASCFAMVHSAQVSEVWRTVVGSLRTGDVLSLDWVGSDDNGYLCGAVCNRPESGTRDERLHHDRLYLNVKRGKRTLVFYLDDSVCADNTARMVRPYGC